MDPNQHCLPNPAFTVAEDGTQQRVPKATRQKIHALNIIGRRKIEATRNQISREVNQWIVAANGLIFYVTQSRGIMFLINVYRFLLIVGILFAGEQNLRYLMASAILVLVPFSFVLAMNVNIILGRSTDIRDSDLIAAHEWLVNTCCACCFRRDNDEEEIDEEAGISVAVGAAVAGGGAAAAASTSSNSRGSKGDDSDDESYTDAREPIPPHHADGRPLRRSTASATS